MAGNQRYSGVRPPDSGTRTQPIARRERLVRMSPPANDNRGQGISLGRLRFTGFRILVVVLIAAAATLVATGVGLI